MGWLQIRSYSEWWKLCTVDAPWESRIKLVRVQNTCKTGGYEDFELVA